MCSHEIPSSLKLFPNLKFNEILGQGAFKKVYRAIDEQEGREVAWNEIQTLGRHLSEGEVKRLLSEVRLLLF